MLDETRKKLIDELSILMEKQEAVQKQKLMTIDEDTKVTLQLKIDEYDKQIHELDDKLSKQQISSSSNNSRSLGLKTKLPQIDFREQIEIVRKNLQKASQSGSLIFLINKSGQMAGDLFQSKFRNLLDDKTVDLRSYSINFTESPITSLDQKAFLFQLKDKLGIKEVEQENHILAISKIAARLVNNINNGSIIFLEIHSIELLDNITHFLDWLVGDFFNSLILQLQNICQGRNINRVKLIILIIANDDISSECNPEFFTQEQKFEYFLLVPIILNNWSIDDVTNWLNNFSALDDTKIDNMSRIIYNSSSGGIPSLIIKSIEKKLNCL